MLRHRVEELADERDDARLRSWLEDHAVPLATRWGHVAPLMLQATLTLNSGRSASSSVADVLDELADRERAAAAAYPSASATS